MSGVEVPAATQEQFEGKTSSSEEDNIFGFPHLPPNWQRYNDLVIFFVDSLAKRGSVSELIRVYAIDIENGSIYRVVDIRASDFIPGGNCNCISVVAYGTKIYAVGGLGGHPKAPDHRDTWIFDIVGTREWKKGPRLQAGKFKPILFTLDQHLYVLDGRSNNILEQSFEVLDLRVDEKDLSWTPLDYSYRLDTYHISAVAIDEKANKVYIRQGHGTHWFEDDVIKNKWRYFNEYNTDRTIVQSPYFFFFPILDGKIYTFNPPMLDREGGKFIYKEIISDTGSRGVVLEKIDNHSGDFVCYDLVSIKKQVVVRDLFCPVDSGYEDFVYFVVPLKSGGAEEFCVVSFFSDPDSFRCVEVVVYLIKSEKEEGEEEEDKNKKTSFEPIAKNLRMTPKLTSTRRYKAREGVRYWPRQVQQLSRLRCTE